MKGGAVRSNPPGVGGCGGGSKSASRSGLWVAESLCLLGAGSLLKDERHLGCKCVSLITSADVCLLTFCTRIKALRVRTLSSALPPALSSHWWEDVQCFISVKTRV